MPTCTRCSSERARSPNRKVIGSDPIFIDFPVATRQWRLLQNLSKTCADGLIARPGRGSAQMRVLPASFSDLVTSDRSMTCRHRKFRKDRSHVIASTLAHSKEGGFVKTWFWIAMLIAAALSGFDGGVAAEPVENMLAPATATNPRNSEGDIVVLRDGKLLVAWSEFTGGASDDSKARIAAARSADGGRTWSPRFTLQENVGTQNVMSVSFLRSRSGEILFFYGVKNSPRELYFMVRRSRDEAQTWTEPVRVMADPGYYVMNNARVVQLRSGRIL